MRTEVVDVNSAVGKLLCTPIFQASGKKLLAKGHQINEEDIRLLGLEGHERVPVAILDDNEIPEDQASSQIAAEAACGAMEIRLAAGGRANLFATENCSFLVDEELLRHVNQSGDVTIATAPNFCFALAGQRVATVKTAPFAVERRNFEATLSLLTDKGPIIQGRPIGTPTVAVLYTDLRSGARGRQLFEGIMKTRLERFRTTAIYALSCVEEEETVARALEHLLRTHPTIVLVASTTAPAGPSDVVGRAMERVGCRIENFLAPVEPGNLLLLAYAEEIPVVSAPGCFRSPRANVVDLILPPLLARYRLSAGEISSLGHGGLLQ